MGKTTIYRLLPVLILPTLLLAENNETLPTSERDNLLDKPQVPTINARSVRGILGENIPLEHARGQLRAGYITYKADGDQRTNAYALAGHFHLDTKRWNGWEIGLSAYTVFNLGINQNPLHVNGDFFDTDGKSFIQLTEAYLDGKWGKTELKLGRQILDTPHADSDDIRMIPNYFEAYTVSNSDIDGLTLTAGFIRQMTGWENGVDTSRFVSIYRTLGADQRTDGVYYAATIYEGIENLAVSLWYYNYRDIADLLYAEVAYNHDFSDTSHLTVGLQYDGGNETGSALLGSQDTQTWGVNFEFVHEESGIHILGAYNKDSGSGATGLSLGGGPFFTSMEDQTLDAVGSAAEAMMIGLGYHFETLGIEGLNAGLTYGHFRADNKNDYESEEIDLVFEYTASNDITFTLAFATVNFDAGVDENGDLLQDFKQFRMMANYNF